MKSDFDINDTTTYVYIVLMILYIYCLFILHDFNINSFETNETPSVFYIMGVYFNPFHVGSIS